MYSFKNILGNELIINSLKTSIKNNKVGHAYILDGEEGVGKKQLANTLAKTLQCEAEKEDCCDICQSCIIYEKNNHPDVIYVTPTKTKALSVEDLREQINKQVNIKPFKYKYKIFIIDNAQTMTIAAQNAILKTIEEPPTYGIFILLTNNCNSLLTTILSRCVIYKIKPLPDLIVEEYLRNNLEDTTNIKLFSTYAQGNIGKSLQISKDTEFMQMREEIISILENITKLDLVQTFLLYKKFELYKDNINDIFDILIIYYRDAIIYKSTEKKQLIIQIDILNQIIFESEFSMKLLFSKLDAINSAKNQLKYNGNFQLTIEMLLLKLKIAK